MARIIKYDYSDDYNPEKAAPSSIDAKVLSWIKRGSRVLELGCSKIGTRADIYRSIRHR